jgi:hypothetical protein
LSAARIRNNQRRCRARRQELVNDLQMKLQDYERRGVEATLQMQQAARAVALENWRLRSLLACRGVSSEEIKNYLEAFDGGASRNPVATPPLSASEPLRRPQRDLHGEMSSGLEVMGTRHIMDAAAGIRREKTGAWGDGSIPLAQDMTELQGGRLARTQVPADASTVRVDKLAVLADVSAQRMCCGPITQCSGAGRDCQKDFAEQSDSSRRREASNSQLSPPSGLSATASPLEMSCNIAASIVTDMHRYGDEELVREALGCNGSRECVVKNTILFQVLDSSERD